MSGYTIIDQQLIEPHITFIRIDPSDIALTLKDVFISLSDLAWITSFDQEYLKSAFLVRAKATIDYIALNIIKANASAVTSNSGEYVISELARKAIVGNMGYFDIPLAELIKVKDVGNHGFDFYSKNTNDILLFGEAKYLASRNAYGSSFEQIVRFEKNKQDSSDIVDINSFCCEDSKNNFHAGQKGFIAAFASKNITTDKLIHGIKKNSHFKQLSKFNEVICVAVNI